jgi:hypothetical protein
MTKPKRQKPMPTPQELEALWRPYPSFIGPVAPPMVLFLRDRAAQAQWEIAMNLRPEHAY